MNNEYTPTSKTKYRTAIGITALLFCFTTMVFIGIIVLYDFHRIYYREKLLSVCFVGAIISFVCSIVFRRNSPKGIKGTVLALNIITFFAGIVAFPFGILTSIGNSMDENRRVRGQELATIENAISTIKNNSLTIHNEQTADSNVVCVDDDKKISDAFVSFHFTLESTGYFCTSDTYLVTKDMTIYLMDDCQSVVVYVPQERTMFGGGHDAGSNRYSISEKSARTLKNLIDSKVSKTLSERKTTYVNENDKLTINDVIDYFDSDLSITHYVRYRESANYDFINRADKNHAINDALRMFDFTPATKVTSRNYSSREDYNIKFSDDRNVCSWKYFSGERIFHIEKTFVVPYEGSKTYYEDYLLTDRLGQNLMNLVREKVSTIGNY